MTTAVPSANRSRPIRPSLARKIASECTDYHDKNRAEVRSHGKTLSAIAVRPGVFEAIYDYDPFGNPPRAKSASESANPVHFSTKYNYDDGAWHCAERSTRRADHEVSPPDSTTHQTALFYYGHRYYSPSLGRFLNSDPIEEQGGINLYSFVGNNAVNNWDLLGMIYQLEDHTPVIWGDGMVGAFSIATLGPITSSGIPIDASVAGAYMLNHGNYFDGATLTASFSSEISYTSHSVEYTTGSITSTFNTASMALPSTSSGSGENSVNHTTIAASSVGSSSSLNSGVVMLDSFVVSVSRLSAAKAQRVDTLRASLRSNLASMSSLQSDFKQARYVAAVGVGTSVLIDTSLIVSGGIAASSVAAREPFRAGLSDLLGEKATYELSLDYSRAAFNGALVTETYAMTLNSPASPGGAVQYIANNYANSMIGRADTASQSYAQQNQAITAELASIYGSR